MLIESNQTATAPHLDPVTPGFPKPSARAKSLNEQLPQPDHPSAAKFRPGSLDSAFPPIEDSRSAEAALDSIRLLIRNDPASTLSAQANSRPETVLELLQGLELQLER